jgi:hypothetical protein
MNEDMKSMLQRVRQARDTASGEPLPESASENVPERDTEPNDKGESFGTTSASRLPEVSLRLRFLKGHRRALPYYLLQDVVFEPDEGILLVFAHCRVKIKGRNLVPLFDRLADHKVRYVREMDALAAEGFSDGETVITHIEVEEVEV